MHWQSVLGQTSPNKIAHDLDTSVQEPVPETCGRQSWQVTGKSQNDHVTLDGISANCLNLHYAAISTDTDYQAPSPKQTSTIHPYVVYLSEWEVFRLLDTLHSTATGSDELPAWFIKPAAPVFLQTNYQTV